MDWSVTHHQYHQQHYYWWIDGWMDGLISDSSSTPSTPLLLVVACWLTPQLDDEPDTWFWRHPTSPSSPSVKTWYYRLPGADTTHTRHATPRQPRPTLAACLTACRSLPYSLTHSPSQSSSSSSSAAARGESYTSTTILNYSFGRHFYIYCISNLLHWTEINYLVEILLRLSSNNNCIIIFIFSFGFNGLYLLCAVMAFIK